jgi:hypothetical protein
MVAIEGPQHAIAEVPGAEHPRCDVGLRPASWFLNDAAELRLLIVTKELLVASPVCPFVEAAAQGGDGCEGHE